MSDEWPHWFKKAEEQYQIDEVEVAVDRFGTRFHDPEQLQCERDMTRTDLREAVKESTPCSTCYPKLDENRKIIEKMEIKNI